MELRGNGRGAGRTAPFPSPWGVCARGRLRMAEEDPHSIRTGHTPRKPSALEGNHHEVPTEPNQSTRPSL